MPPLNALLKWPGSKRRYTGPILEWMGAPVDHRVIEPFLGAGNVWTAVWSSGWRHGLLCDAEPRVMAFHMAVADDPVAVHRELQRLPDTTKTSWREHYYEVRQAFNDEWDPDLIGHLHAARMLWLNKTTTNGLWRLNRQGRFNASIGSYKTVKMPGVEQICAISRCLSGAQLRAATSWQACVRDAAPGDLIYADPPWPGTFAGYTPSGHVDHEELVIELARARDRGVRVLLDTSWGDDLAEQARELSLQVERFYTKTTTSIGMGTGEHDSGRKPLPQVWIHTGPATYRYLEQDPQRPPLVAKQRTPVTTDPELR
jgi:DNA adenine methylase